VIYSDFNCPFCYATHERLEALGLHTEVAWRGVEHAPELPVPMRPANDSFAAEIECEVRSIRVRAPEVPIEVPPGKPNTGPAIRFAAAVFESEPGAGPALLLELYRRLWREGEDISDPGVIAAAADSAGVSDPPPAERARELTELWRAAWLDLGLGGVPLLLRPGGAHLYGLAEASALRELVTSAQPPPSRIPASS